MKFYLIFILTSMSSHFCHAMTSICDRTYEVRIAIEEELGPCDVITEEMLVDLWNLNLNAPNLTELKENDFEGLIGLDHIGIFDTQLTTLPEKIFENLKKLKEVDITGNRKLTKIPARLFDYVKNVENIYLEENAIEELSPELIQDLKNLRVFSIYSNKLTTLPRHFFDNLKSLEALNLRDNDFSDLPDAVHHLQIDALYLNSGKWTASQIAKISKINRLNLNDFRAEHGALYFSKNERLSQFFPNLIELNIYGSLELNSNFEWFSNDQDLSGFKYLQGLRLWRFPKLAADGKTFAALPKSLTYLSIAYSDSISEFADDLFNYTPNLQFITLPENRLKSLPIQSLAQLKKLERLQIDRNAFSDETKERIRSSINPSVDIIF